jgi:hypothetical protein
MARYEHLPIYKKAFDLFLYFEKIVRKFSRYDKYTLGAGPQRRCEVPVNASPAENEFETPRTPRAPR